MKKVFAFVIAMAMCLSFVACSGNPSSSTSGTSTTETPVETEAPVATEAPAAPVEEFSGSSSTNKSSGSKFTNKYGTATTKCAHSGCNNYIASSGDTNCCTTHSNKCLDCKKYIDEDAMYCMSCLTDATTKSSKSSSSSNKKSSTNSKKSSSGGKSSGSGAGGYDMPNASDKSFSDYVKRVDPELYDSLFG